MPDGLKMTKRVLMAYDTSRLGMVSRHMGHVDGDQDDKVRGDVALRDLGLEQRQGRAE